VATSSSSSSTGRRFNRASRTRQVGFGRVDRGVGTEVRRPVRDPRRELDPLRALLTASSLGFYAPRGQSAAGGGSYVHVTTQPQDGAMPQTGFKATSGPAQAFRRRRTLWAVALGVPSLAGAVLIGAAQSEAQYEYPEYPAPPPPTTPTPGAPPPTTSPGQTPSPGAPPPTTSPAPTPSPSPKPTRNTVVIEGTSTVDYRFRPRTLRVRRGKRVRWTWNSNAPHNVVFRKLRKRSRTAPQGSFALRFRRRGTHRYLCTVHDFGGKVVVR
jgi:plastocyanin